MKDQLETTSPDQFLHYDEGFFAAVADEDEEEDEDHEY